MNRPTIKDIARAANVGTATVERVLNSRGGVKEGLAERVIRAAKALGYGERQPGLHRGIIRIEVILVRSELAFYARLNTAFERISASLDPSIVIHRTFLDEDDSLGVARHIAQPSFRRSGLIVSVPDYPG